MRITIKSTAPLTRCKIITSAILSIGFVYAGSIYLTATAVLDDPLSEFEQTKKFTYQIERIGGKTALVASYVHQWFVGLWRGQTLSYTVAAFTIILAACYYFIATSLAADAQELLLESHKRCLQDK